MADVNNCVGKRKALCSQIIFELEGDELQLPNSPISENNEPISKMTKKEDMTDTSVSNLYQELSQNSVETNISMLEKLSELQEENKKLKRQLEEFANNVCKCNLKSSGTDVSDSKTDTVITLKFHDEHIAEEYRGKFKKFLGSFIEFTCTEESLNITIAKKDETIDRSDCKSPSKKRKRKKSKSKSKDVLFTVDTTPSLSTSEVHLKYVSKYLVTSETESSAKEEHKIVSAQTCFNCDQSHSLRDCPEPKNFVKINAARNKLKQQQSKPRYHLDEDQKYAHLKPGEISVDLKEALGIGSNELPPYIYRMRKCGYPPGWMEDARVTHSNISLFDIDGKECSTKAIEITFDSDKVIEYSGFNMPMEKGVKDNFQYHDCPPYSEKCSKSMMLEYINKMCAKEQDNLETCDMELDQSSDEIMLPPGCEPSPSPLVTINDTQRLSPSLIDLEAKKKELLAALEDGATNSSVDKNVNCVNVNDDSDKKNDSLSDSFVVIDDSEQVADVEETQEEDGDGSFIELDAAKAEIVTKSTFGTPIVKTGSPFSKLPDSIHFSKGVSPVINFENLPNATGKYEQMNGILQKIRRTLKNFNKS